MDEKYRLVFRGEVLDGQHRAVVKRRLVESLKLTDEQAEKLFSGASVVLKKAVDAGMAARYQALFKQAGGRLRVHSLTPASAAENPKAPVPPTASESASNARPSGAAESISREPAVEEVDSPTADDSVSPSLTLLSLEEVDKAVAATSGERVEINAPDFAIAELGEDLADTVETVVAVVPETEFSLAAAGEDLLVAHPEPLAVELGPLDFEIAEIGANLIEPTNQPVPDAPDISHLRLAEEA